MTRIFHTRTALYRSASHRMVRGMEQGPATYRPVLRRVVHSMLPRPVGLEEFTLSRIGGPPHSSLSSSAFICVHPRLPPKSFIICSYRQIALLAPASPLFSTTPPPKTACTPLAKSFRICSYPPITMAGVCKSFRICSYRNRGGTPPSQSCATPSFSSVYPQYLCSSVFICGCIVSPALNSSTFQRFNSSTASPQNPCSSVSPRAKSFRPPATCHRSPAASDPARHFWVLCFLLLLNFLHLLHHPVRFSPPLRNPRGNSRKETQQF